MDPPVSTPPSPFDSAIILELPEFLSEAGSPAHPDKGPQVPKSASPPKEIPADQAFSRLVNTIARKPPPGTTLTIEERMMRKTREAQTRFAVRKKQIESERMKEVKSVPTIDPLSRKMAEQNFMAKFFPDKTLHVPDRKPPAKPEVKSEYMTPAFPSPKSGTPLSFLNSIQKADSHAEKLDSALREKRENLVLVPRCHVSLPLGASTKVYLPVRLGPEDNSKLVAPDVGLTAVARLRQIRVEEEQIHHAPDPLEMSVLDRNQYFLEQKQRRLQAELDKKKLEEDKACTFAPTISRVPHDVGATPQSSISMEQSVQVSDRSKISELSYTDRYHKKQEMMRSAASSSVKRGRVVKDQFRVDNNVRIPPPNSVNEGLLPRAQPAPPRENLTSHFYTQLSPTAQTLGFKAGCDILALQEKLKPKKK